MERLTQRLDLHATDLTQLSYVSADLSSPSVVQTNTWGGAEPYRN